MKHVLMTAVLASGLLASAHASADTNNVGCGLGSMVWENSKGVFPQVFAAITNGTFGTQTFGISSQTSGCSPNGKVTVPDKSTAMFIAPNLDRLAQDMSRGEGETLTALAETMRIAPADQPRFFAVTQANFTRIVPADDATAGDVVTSLYQVMSEDETLRHYVVS